MTTHLFRSPVGYVQGRGVLDELGNYADPLGESALVLGDDFVLDLVGDRVRGSLEAAGFDGALETFGGECSEAEIEWIADVHTEYSADVIVGAGGGKAIDTARAFLSFQESPPRTRARQVPFRSSSRGSSPCSPPSPCPNYQPGCQSLAAVIIS